MRGLELRQNKLDMTLHAFLDTEYGRFGDVRLRSILRKGADLEMRRGPAAETPLHVAVRRCRLQAVQQLVRAGAKINTLNAYQKTAYAHAVRRGFTAIATCLTDQGASTLLTEADQLAVAMSSGREAEARQILSASPHLAHTGNPGEDRLLADMAGRNADWPVRLLIDAQASLTAPGLDGGTPLHQAAWFGELNHVHTLLAAGAPLEVWCTDHSSSPLGWAVHGSRESGGASSRQEVYTAIVTTFLDAGARLHYADDDTDAYYRRLLRQASPSVRVLLREAWKTH